MSRVIPPDHETPPQDAPRIGPRQRGVPDVRKATGDVLLGHKLRKSRLKGDYLLKQPAHFAGIKPSSLSDYEAGRSWPPAPVLKKLADFYGVSVDWLLRHISGKDTAA